MIILKYTLVISALAYFASFIYITVVSFRSFYEQYSEVGKMEPGLAYGLDSWDVTKGSSHIVGVAWLIIAFPIIKAILAFCWPIYVPYLILTHFATNNFKQKQLADKLRDDN